MTQPPNHKDYTQLYQEIADYVIIRAHSGDPFFEKIFEWAWKKASNLNENKAGLEWQSHRPASIAQNDPGGLHGI